jgi:hypothetical protein
MMEFSEEFGLGSQYIKLLRVSETMWVPTHMGYLAAAEIEKSLALRA